VWDRWNALTPRDQASEFLEQDATLLRTLEGLTPGQREKLEIKLGFLPAPLPLATVAGMRLNEAAQHSWDVRVALDPAATLDSDSADVLLEHFTGGMGFLLGFIGEPDQVSQPARVAIEGTDVVIGIGDQVSLSTPATGATAAFRGQPEAAVRLLCGRLTSPYTPEGVEVTGNLTLDDLRRVFPGF
jgi:hypothetical protein